MTTRSYVNFAVLPNANCAIVFEDSTSSQFGLYFKVSDSKIYCGYLVAGVVTFGATGVAVTTGIQYRLDMKIDVSGAINDVVDGQVDGVALGQGSIASVASVVAVFRLGSPQTITADIFYDDVAWSETPADYPLGAGQVWCAVPTSDGTHNVAGAADFRRGDTSTDITNATTTAYQLVDDVPLDDVTPDADDHIRIVAPPNATDYVEVVFGPAPGFAAITGTINGVQVITEHFAAGTGLSDEQVKLNDNGTINTIYDGTQVAGTTTGIYKTKHYATAPSTGAAWTAALVNALRLRYGYATDANPDKSLMCAMLEVDYTPASASAAGLSRYYGEFIAGVGAGG